MTTCVVFDAGRVTEADARRAAEGLSEVVYVVEEDTAWEAASLPFVTVPSRRSSGFRRELMELVDHLSDTCRRDLETGRLLVAGGADLLEVARYDWYGQLADAVHRARTVQLLTKRFSPERIVWVGADGGGRRDASSSPFGAALATLGLELHVVGVTTAATAPVPRRGRVIVREVRARAKRAGRRARLLAQPFRPLSRPVGGEPVVLQAEHFERGARVAALLAAELKGVAGHFVAVRPEALPLGSDVPADLLLSVSSRRARMAASAAETKARRAARRLVRLVEAAAERGEGPLGPYLRLLVPGLEAGATTAWSSAASSTVLWTDVVHRLCPSVVAATTNAPSGVRGAMAAGRLVGAATCLVQHGVLTTQSRAYLDHDRYLVWGERDRQLLVGLGAPDDRIVVTGNPLLDDLAERAAAVDRRERDQDGGHARVLYLPSRTGGRFVSVEAAATMLRWVVDAVDRVADASLTVKVHPGDGSGLVDGLGPEVRVVRDGDTHAEISSADVVIASTSTAGFEACALDRPVVVLSHPSVAVPREYETHGAALLASDPASLRAAVGAALQGHDEERLQAGRRALVEDVFDGLRRGAARRAAQELEALASARWASNRELSSAD